MSELDAFLEKVSRFDQVIDGNQRDKAEFEVRQDQLITQLRSDMQSLEQCVDPENPLKAHIGSLAGALDESFETLKQQVKRLQERLKFRETFNERLIIIIYGKVNAGKSTFANYLVRLLSEELAEQSNQFVVEGGEVRPSQNSLFEEGVTETTSIIQGARIGNIVLLDSPGLHSVTEENGTMAEDFTESADLILWLTSSVSPGQEMELEALGREIDKKKVIVPVITGSDRTLHDEEDGQLFKVLTMKPLEDRQAQQKDVSERTLNLFERKGFDSSVLKEPVSLSVLFSAEYPELENVHEQSGIEALLSRINSVYEDVIEAKLENAGNQVENHLRQVRIQLQDEGLFPALDQLQAEIDQRRDQLDQRSQKISQTLLNEMYVRVQELIDEAAERKDTNLLANRIETLLTEKLDELVREELFDMFQSLVNAASKNLTFDVNLEEKFKDVELEYKEVRGKGVKGGIEGAATVAGAVAGSFVPGAGTLVGGAIGGLVGGLAGNLIGNQVVQEITQKEIIGVDSAEVATEINEKLDALVPGIVNQTMGNLLAHLEPLEQRIAQMKKTVETF